MNIDTFVETSISTGYKNWLKGSFIKIDAMGINFVSDVILKIKKFLHF